MIFLEHHHNGSKSMLSRALEATSNLGNHTPRLSKPCQGKLTVFPSGTGLSVPHTVTVASVESVRAL